MSSSRNRAYFSTVLVLFTLLSPGTPGYCRKDDAESDTIRLIENDTAKADESAKKLKEVDPNSEQGKALASTLTASKNNIEQTITKNPTPRVYNAGASSAFKLGDYQTGLARADQAIALAQSAPNPDNKLISAAMTTKASGYALMGDHRKAVATALEALKVDNQNKEAFAVYQLSKGRPNALGLPASAKTLAPPAQAPKPAPPAEPAALKSPAPAAAPSPAAAPLTLKSPAQGLIDDAKRKIALKDLTPALETLNRAVTQDPNALEARLERAKVSNMLKNYPGAVADADKILSLDPKNVRALLERSLAQLQLGNIKGALADAETAVGLDPQNALAYFYRAQAEEKLGLLAKAKEDFKNAASLDPSLLAASASAADAGAPKPAAPAPDRSGRMLFRGAYILAALLMISFGLRGAKTMTGRVVKRVASEASAPAQSSATLPPGFVLGDNFRIIRELGRGGMGVVYEAEDKTLKRKVAIKQLYRSTHTFQEDLDRFLGEARAAAKLKHPNIVEIHSVVEQDDLYLVFDHIDGQSLAGLLKSRKPLAPEEAANIIRGIAAAVDYAHSQRVIHRDLKPANVLIAKDGRCLVTDFGVARRSNQDYAAPEQAAGPAGKPSDIYALGAIAHELLTGELPAKNTALAAPWTAFFAKALALDPLKRFPNAAELVSAFEEAAKASTNA